MKKILYVVIGLLVVYIILCLAGPSSAKVERSTEINAPADMIRSKITDLKFFHESWSPWTEKDPNMKVTYSGEPGKEGSSMSWESDKKEVGKGSMTYKYTHNDTVMQSLNFEGQGEAKVYHIVTADGDNKSKVSWLMQNDVPFLFRAVMLFMNIDKMVGPDFEKGLSKLKAAMESAPSQPTAQYEIQELNWDAKTYYGKRDKMEFSKMAEYIGKTYGLVGEALAKAKVTPIGAPKAIYFSFDETTLIGDFAPVIEVPNNTKLNGVDKFETPAAKVLMIDYYGSYEKSSQAHQAMGRYMKEKGLTESFVLEEYITDPMMEKDTAKWLTKIYYGIK